MEQDASIDTPDGDLIYKYAKPRTDLVPSVGLDDSFEIATWNIENFPKNDNTPAIVADIIASLDLDMVTLQEVQNVDAFDELVERLRGYEGVLSSHTYGDGSYQKIGYIYRKEMVSLGGAFLLFDSDGYEFPRPALKVDVNVKHSGKTLNFTSIALHLKAGGSFTDKKRRKDAVVILENFMSNSIVNGNSKIMVLGDFNATLTRGANVFTPLSSDTEHYSIRTAGNENNGDVSFVPSNALLDHIVTTTDLDTELPGMKAIIPRLDQQMSGYEGKVSDHLPVIVRSPL